MAKSAPKIAKPPKSATSTKSAKSAKPAVAKSAKAAGAAKVSKKSPARPSTPHLRGSMPPKSKSVAAKSAKRPTAVAVRPKGAPAKVAARTAPKPVAKVPAFKDKPVAAAARSAAPKPAPLARLVGKPVTVSPAPKKGLSSASAGPKVKPVEVAVVAVSKVAPSAKASKAVKSDRQAERPVSAAKTVSKPIAKPTSVAPPVVAGVGSSSKTSRPAAHHSDDLEVKPDRPRKVSTGLNARDLNFFRDLLLDKRREILGDMTSMESEALGGNGSNLSTLPVHMADMGTDNYEQEFTLGLVEKDRNLLREIYHALAKIQKGNDGRFGICEGTGDVIGRPRLEVQPWARFGIEFARQRERHGMGIR